MNPLTHFIFEEIGSELSGAEVSQRMEYLGATIAPETEMRTRFRYVDGGEIWGYLYVSKTGKIESICFSLGLETDSRGWEGWSEKNEQLRLRMQAEWLAARNLKTGDFGRTAIINSYHPKSGFSSIVISYHPE